MRHVCHGWVGGACLSLLKDPALQQVCYGLVARIGFPWEDHLLSGGEAATTCEPYGDMHELVCWFGRVQPV